MEQAQEQRLFDVTPLRAGVTKFNGCVLPICFKDYIQEIEDLEVRDDDIWVTSYPKSGTTWTQEMVYMITTDLDFEGAKVTLDKRFLHLELGILFDFKGYKQKHFDFECEDYLMEPIKVIKSLKGRRLIKTHLPWQLLPLEIRNQTKKPKIIHVFRNPKDVVVSYYHHALLLKQVSTSLEEYCQKFITSEATFAPYWGNVYGFWNRRHFSNVLFLTYEEMKQDLPKVIREVSTFLGQKELNDEEMLRLVEHLSFENMKNNPAVGKNELLATIDECVEKERDTSRKFIRAGKVGSYIQELSKGMIRDLDEWIAENTKGTDLKVTG